MKIVILIFSFCAIFNTVKAPSPFNIQNAKLPSVKTDYPSKAPKPPKRYDFTSKINDIKKPAADSNLANLLKGKPLIKTNDFKIDAVKMAENETTNNEEGFQNVNKVLYADEIEVQTETTDLEIQNIPEVVKKDDSKGNFIANNFTKKFMRSEEKNKIGPIPKPKANNNAQQKPLDLPPSMIPIFKPNPNIVRSQAKNENVEPISNVLKPPQEAFADTPINNYPTHDVIPTAARSILPVQDFKPETAGPVSLNHQLPVSVLKQAAENPNEKLIPSTNEIKFNIPCQKASDVLQDIPAKSELCVRPNFEPKERGGTTNLQEQKKVEKTDKFETDESLAIIFKPKNISLFNVYGDLLKKVTLTVLVPYHISKLGTQK